MSTDATEAGAAQPSTGRIAAVGALSALLGVLVGVGVASVTTDNPTPVAVAPVIQLSGSESPDRVSAVAAVAGPSVVRVDVAGIGTGGTGNGSGVVVSDAGHIVTNLHVVAGATSIVVEFADGDVARATLVGEDEDHDLALIQAPRADVAPIAFADSDDVQVGQLAVVIGAPFGLSGSVTAGVVSAVGRPIDIVGLDGSALRLPSVLQTDAEINPGNSGGPVVDSDGRLIGITSAILSGDGPTSAGVGFAVPANVVRRSVEALIADGQIARPRLGVTGRSITAREQADGQPAGALVEAVAPGSPAARSGLRAGDVLAAVDGGQLRTMEDLVLAVREAGVGGRIAVTVIRDDRESTVQVTLAAGP